MEKVIYRTSFIEGDSTMAFEFSSFVDMSQFIHKAFEKASRPDRFSVVVHQMKIDVKEVGLNE